MNIFIGDNGLGYCIYCRNPLEVMDTDYHKECNDDVEEYKNTAQNEERLEIERESRRVMAMRAARRAETARKRAETVANNKADKIERINHIVYYQFLDDYNCIIFVCYDTIVGVLHEHKFYTVENNFSLTTGSQISNILPYGGIPITVKKYYNTYDGEKQSYDTTEYTNHTEVPIREFERILERIGISHLQRIGEGTAGNYYYERRSTVGTWLNVCETRWNVNNSAADKLEQWIGHNLEFNRDRYDIYLKVQSTTITLRIWDRKLMKYKTLGYAQRKWEPEDKKSYALTEVYKYGFRPLKKLLLKQRGFEEKNDRYLS